MFRTMLRSAALVGCTGAAIIGADAAIAAPAAVYVEDGRQKTVVSYADLNLATPAGQHALRSRVLRATRLVCAEAGLSSFDWTVESCRRRALTHAQPKVHAAIGKATGVQVASANASAAAR